MGFIRNGQPLRAGKAFTDDEGNQYPRNWATVFNEEQKAALGITWEPDPAPVDTRFYWDHNLPKRLEDEPAVDENGDAILDADGEQVINRGLKTEWVAKQKEIAGSLLSQSDWYITRKVDTGIDVPAAVKQYRDNVRLTCGLREDQILQCATTEELVELLTNPAEVYDSTVDSMVPNTERFIISWPSQNQ